MTEPSPFIGSLLRLVAEEDRGALAALRRGLGHAPGTVAAMYPYVEPYLRADATRWRTDACYIVASLFASHPLDWRSGDDDARASNFGASFARLRARMTSSEGAERRFMALLGCHREELAHHLRSAVSLLKSQDVPIDWEQLLRDIQWWDGNERRVQRAWANAFWGAAGQQDSPGAETSAIGKTEDDKEE
jgi:CRISPR system Cascade subunit CasB